MWAVLAVYLLLIFAMLTVATSTLCWMLDAWRTPESALRSGFDEPDEPRLTFSLIVPARHEEAVLAHTVDTLLLQDHPGFDVIVVVGHDDAPTWQVADELAERHEQVRVVVDHHEAKNKPKALNLALAHCTGDVVGVFDAEDEVAPGLLRHVDSCFRARQADVVQGGVQLMNYQSSWWSLRNVMEYFFWFASRLHFHARNRFIPLGGNTVFVRRDLLQMVGGWDQDCLAEDCELGIRLSALGARTVVAYTPSLATQEETPPTLKGLIKQRTRWNQGYLQVLRKGEWRVLPTRSERMFARYLLAMPFAQAASGALVPISLLTIFLLKTPDLFVMLTFTPLLPLVGTVAIEMVGLREFGRMYNVKIRFVDQLKLVVGTVPYQIVLAVAAVRASWREYRGHQGWEKTEHVGAHRGLELDLEQGQSR